MRSISSLIAEPPGPIIDPESSLEIKNFIDIKFFTPCREGALFGEILGVETLSICGLGTLAILSLIFLL